MMKSKKINNFFILAFINQLFLFWKKKKSDEQIAIDFSKIPSDVVCAVFVIKVFTSQTFKQIHNEYFHAVDVNNNDMIRFELDKEPKFDSARAAIMCSLRRNDNENRKFSVSVCILIDLIFQQLENWSVVAIGEPVPEGKIERFESYQTYVWYYKKNK